MLHAFSASNYKSLKDVHLDNLPPLMVLVGPNASGKSNFLDALDFVGAVFRDGLDSALAERGGFENVASRRQRRARGAVEFTLIYQDRSRQHLRKSEPPKFWRYRLAFRATGQTIDSDIEISAEQLDCADAQSGPYTLVFSRSGGIIRPGVEDAFRFANGESEIDEAGWGFEGEPIARFLNPTLRGWFGEFSHFRTYQVSPLIAREPSAPGRDRDVGRYGENLASALRRLSSSSEKRYQELIEQLRVAVPTIEKVEADYVDTKKLGLFFKEAGFSRRWFADEVSDGTIQALALFLVLLSRDPAVIVEEPETSLHPWILRHFMSLAREVAERDHPHQRSQVIISTHSPICVDGVPPESLYVTRRTDQGTQIERALDTLENRDGFIDHLASEALGLGSSWDAGLLGGVPG